VTSERDLKDLLRNARDVLIKQAAERDAALSKTAELEAENDVMRGVLDLVGAGLIDPDDVTTKLAEYMQDPAQLQVIKQAAAAGFVVSSELGKLAGENPEIAGDTSTPAGRLMTNLRNIVLNP